MCGMWWCALVNILMNLSDPYKGEEFFDWLSDCQLLLNNTARRVTSLTKDIHTVRHPLLAKSLKCLLKFDV